jgi:hypothetical protein
MDAINERDTYARCQRAAKAGVDDDGEQAIPYRKAYGCLIDETKIMPSTTQPLKSSVLIQVFPR